MSQDRTPGPTWTETAELLAAMPDALARLRGDHQPDGHGMCQACTTGGTGTRDTPWPCGIRQLADLAAGIAARRGRP